jgi:hypothetical protein
MRSASPRVAETTRDRRELATEAGFGRVSVVSLFGGVAAAMTAFALLMGTAAAATAAIDFDTDLMSQEWTNIDAPDAAIVSIALFLACVFGGYVAGRMARRAGLSHGFYTFALGVVVLVAAVAGLEQMTNSDALIVSFSALGIPTTVDAWRDLSAPVGLAWLLTAFAGTCAGAVAGERWHTKLVVRAADPTVGPTAAARVDAGKRLRGQSGMVDVRERLGDPAVPTTADPAVPTTAPAADAEPNEPTADRAPARSM